MTPEERFTKIEANQLQESIERLRDRQEATGEKLHILIKNVDRIFGNK